MRVRDEEGERGRERERESGKETTFSTDSPGRDLLQHAFTQLGFHRLLKTIQLELRQAAFSGFYHRASSGGQLLHNGNLLSRLLRLYFILAVINFEEKKLIKIYK